MSQDAMLVFGYARVSTENQLENYSIEEQTARLKAYCSAKGWTLLHLYVDGGDDPAFFVHGSNYAGISPALCKRDPYRENQEPTNKERRHRQEAA